MTEVTTRDGMRWRVRRRGEGPVALALHGTGSSGASFDALAERLDGALEIVAPDLPGHAGTRPPGWFTPTPASMARAVAELVERLALRPELLIGHSAGAAIAAHMLLDGRVAPRLTVGLAPALAPLTGVARAVLPRWARLLGATGASRLIARRSSGRVEEILGGVGTALDPEGLRRYRELAGAEGHVQGVLAMMGLWDLAPLYARLPHLDRPFLLIAGQNDRAVPLRQLRQIARRLPRASLEVVRDVGHLPHEEDPTRVAALIEAAYGACN